VQSLHPPQRVVTSSVAVAAACALLIAATTLYHLAIFAQERGARLVPRLTNSVGMEFLLIPAGTFTMGAIDSYPDEQPIRTVRISRPFYLGKYEVTQAQWEAVMGYNPSSWRGQRDLPVEQVSWEDVQEFLRRLNAEEGGTRYRLPTEAEWEYAARAGTTTAYSFSSDVSRLDEYAWYGGNAAHTSHPVGQLKPNAWGLHDMHGNVWEWVHDWYETYPIGAVTDPQGPAAGINRVFRGGGRSNVAWRCRSSSRSYRPPESRLDAVGFRVLKTVS
jgi:formylglycine-generating enzyme required for sulfatase activity